MSNELSNHIKQNVMDRIRSDDVNMRPRIYFVAGTILTLIGIFASAIVSIFLFNITNFVLRSHGPGAQYRLEQLISSFPWWAPVLAVIGIFFGLKLLSKYEFVYKRSPVVWGLGFIAAVILTTWFLDVTNIDRAWLCSSPMRGFNRRYIETDQIPNIGQGPRDGSGPGRGEGTGVGRMRLKQKCR